MNMLDVKPYTIQEKDPIAQNRKMIEKLLNSDVLIVGFANTGLAAAGFLANHGCKVTVSERRQKSEFESILKTLDDLDIHLEFGGHQEKTFLNRDWILVSPGVPMDIPPLIAARTKGIPILSDIELAFYLANIPIIAITGTNGKTTSTALLGEILKADSKNVFVGGNIGTPVLQAFKQDIDYDFLVMEVSSFQLEGVKDFAPHIAAILNLTPDHLDRYPNMTAYKRAKAKILERQTYKDFAILNAHDKWVASLSKKCSAQIYLFDYKSPVPKGTEVRNGHIILHDENRRIDLGPLEQMGLAGSHNIDNMMAASLAAYLAGVSDESIRNALKEFKGLPHRMERIGNIHGIQFINDSKGTNVGAVIKALESIDPPIILIAGGQDKGGDFKSLFQLVSEKVRAIFLIGEATSKIADALNPYTEIIESEDLRSAVFDVYKMAKPGYTVLFSPGCASFDMFRDYKDRGEQFKKIVMELENA